MLRFFHYLNLIIVIVVVMVVVVVVGAETAGKSFLSPNGKK
jgi:hypothetical protein